MTGVFVGLGFCVLIWGVGFIIGYALMLPLRRYMYRKQWMDKGYEDAMLPYSYRFTPDAKWLRRYYDEGYALGQAQKERESE